MKQRLGGHRPFQLPPHRRPRPPRPRRAQRQQSRSRRSRRGRQPRSPQRRGRPRRQQPHHPRESAQRPQRRPPRHSLPAGSREAPGHRMPLRPASQVFVPRHVVTARPRRWPRRLVPTGVTRRPTQVACSGAHSPSLWLSTRRRAPCRAARHRLLFRRRSCSALAFGAMTPERLVEEMRGEWS